MVEVAIQPLFCIDLLKDAKLQLAKDSVFEEEIYQDVVAFILKSVLYFNYL